MKTCDFAYEFLTSLQSYFFAPTIDKPTRVYNTSATLIDNIFLNNPGNITCSGNVITDVSDHFTQFCITSSIKPYFQPKKAKIRDYTTFSSSSFNEAIQTSIVIGVDRDIDREFSCFYRKLNKLIDKHAPMKTISKRKNKQFSKPWITRGIKKSIKVKNTNTIQLFNIALYLFWFECLGTDSKMPFSTSYSNYKNVQLDSFISLIFKVVQFHYFILQIFHQLMYFILNPLQT